MITCHVSLYSVLIFLLLCINSLEREEAEDLVKRHGGRVTGSVSKKTVTHNAFYSIAIEFARSVCDWTYFVCRIICYVMKILGDGSPKKLKS